MKPNLYVENQSIAWETFENIIFINALAAVKHYG